MTEHPVSNLSGRATTSDQRHLKSGETVSIRLDSRDRIIARREAKKRLRSFEEDPNWDTSKKSFGVSAFDREYRGVMGEIALAHYADLSIDSREYRRTDAHGDFDVKYREERVTIDVKTSNKEPYALMVKEGTVSADYYILAHLDDSTVTFYGMATSEEVRSKPLVETPPDKDHMNHEIPIEDLDPLPPPDALKPIG